MAVKRRRGRGPTPSLARKKATKKFNAVVSLGSICLTARFLERHSIRKQKFPFDWMYGSARLVRHCLADDFKQFLSDGQLHTWRDKRGTGHKLYEKMQLGKRSAVWPHHRLTNKVDKDSFKRAVDRLRTLLADARSRTMFVLVQSITNQAMLETVHHRGSAILSEQKVPIPTGPSYEQGSVEEVRRLFKNLRQAARGSFHFDVVNLVVPGISKESGKRPFIKQVHSEGARDCSLAVHDLYCRGDNTGLFFKHPQDHKALQRILVDGRSFDIELLHDESSANMLVDDQAVVQRKVARGMKRSTSSSRSQPRKAALRKAVAKFRRQPTGTVKNLQQKLKIRSDNPKAVGSSAHQRYQRYRVAKTVGEFFKRGGMPGDLKYDKEHGFIRFVR